MQNLCIELLNKRGVTVNDIVDCVVYLQEGFNQVPNVEVIEKDVMGILNKREVQHALMTGIAIDEQTEKGDFGNPELNHIIAVDESLYGIDEVLAYGICNLYGSIALTNFGFIDRVKPGIIGKLNDHSNGSCNTFLDDIVGAIAAAAASKSAHTDK